MTPIMQAIAVVVVVLTGVGIMVLSTIGAALSAAKEGNAGRPQLTAFSWMTTAFLGLFVAVGLFFAGQGVHAAWRDHVSTLWPRVPGQITRSVVKDESDSDGTSYRPDVGYRYTIDGKEWTGERISFGIERSSTSRRVAARYVGRYRVGAPVLVAYQPGQPELCTLETGLTRRSFLNIIFGMGFAMAGFGLGWAARQRERRGRPEWRPFSRVLPVVLITGAYFGLLSWLAMP